MVRRNQSVKVDAPRCQSRRSKTLTWTVHLESFGLSSWIHDRPLWVFWIVHFNPSSTVHFDQTPSTLELTLENWPKLSLSHLDLENTVSIHMSLLKRYSHVNSIFKFQRIETYMESNYLALYRAGIRPQAISRPICLSDGPNSLSDQTTNKLTV